MHHDLFQSKQRRSQPRKLPLSWRTLSLVLLSAAALLAAALLPSGERSSQAQIAQPIVLLSGRDDHGLLQLPQVPLQRSPDASAAVGSLPDGSFVRVVDTYGEWLRVRSISTPRLEGWVNDFYLRGRALRLDGKGQVRMVDARVEGGSVHVAVRPIAAPQATPVWLPARLLGEVGAHE